MLDIIPSLVTHEKNEQIKALPTMEEVKRVVFQLNGASTNGPDGFTGLFFQTC